MISASYLGKIYQNITSYEVAGDIWESFEILRAGIYPKYPAESMLFFVCIVRNTLTGLNQSLLRNTSLVIQIKSFPRIHGIRAEDDSNHIPNGQKLPWHRVGMR